MKLVLPYKETKLPHLFAVMAVIFLTLAGLTVVAAYKLLLDSQDAQAMIVLVRVGVSVIPSFAWLGALLIVALWLALLLPLWLRQGLDL